MLTYADVCLGLADRDRDDFLGGQELRMPWELGKELDDLGNKVRMYEGEAAEAVNKHGALLDQINLRRCAQFTCFYWHKRANTDAAEAEWSSSARV
jgi:hypothetical protein